MGKHLKKTLIWILLFQFEAGVELGLRMLPYCCPPFVEWVNSLIGPVAGAQEWKGEEWMTWKVATQDAATVDECSGKTQIHPFEEHALDFDRRSEMGCPLKGMGLLLAVESDNGVGRWMGNLKK